MINFTKNTKKLNGDLACIIKIQHKLSLKKFFLTYLEIMRLFFDKTLKLNVL